MNSKIKMLIYNTLDFITIIMLFFGIIIIIGRIIIVTVENPFYNSFYKNEIIQINFKEFKNTEGLESLYLLDDVLSSEEKKRLLIMKKSPKEEQEKILKEIIIEKKDEINNYKKYLKFKEQIKNFYEGTTLKIATLILIILMAATFMLAPKSNV